MTLQLQLLSRVQVGSLVPISISVVEIENRCFIGPGKSSKLQEGVVSADNKPGGNVTEPSTVTVVDVSRSVNIVFTEVTKGPWLLR